MSGLPDLDDFSTLGGELQEDHPVENPLTDLDVLCDNIARMDTSMMTRMSPRAYVVFFWNGSSMGIQEHDALWGNDPSVAPVPTRTSAGLYVLTWPTSVVDPMGNTHSLNFRRGWGHVEGSPYGVHPERTSPNVMTVRVYNSGSPADPTSCFIVVWVV